MLGAGGPGRDCVGFFLTGTVDRTLRQISLQGLDGIAFGWQHYVNNFTNGQFFRADVKDRMPGKIIKLQPSRSLKFPDGRGHESDPYVGRCSW
jgi:hypothetical protein